MSKICVLGSLNIDMSTSVDYFPHVGETIRLNSFDIFMGGKGANQAVALGKLSADIMMLGKLGDQFYGPEYMNILKENDVDNSCVEIVPNEYPGIAFITVNKDKNNVIYIHPGTNYMVDTAYVDKYWDKISQCDIILHQYEIPIKTNIYLMKKMHKAGKTVILDPAPYLNVADDTYALCDYVTPNEVELSQITGMPVDNHDQFIAAAKALLKKGCGAVIAKAGKRGAYLITPDTTEFVPSYKVNAVDPTAAGDSFNAGFAYALSQGKSPIQAIKFANAVGGLSTTAMGAQNAMPTLKQVEDFLKTAEINDVY